MLQYERRVWNKLPDVDLGAWLDSYGGRCHWKWRRNLLNRFEGAPSNQHECIHLVAGRRRHVRRLEFVSNFDSSRIPAYVGGQKQAPVLVVLVLSLCFGWKHLCHGNGPLHGHQFPFEVRNTDDPQTRRHADRSRMAGALLDCATNGFRGHERRIWQRSWKDSRDALLLSLRASLLHRAGGCDVSDTLYCPEAAAGNGRDFKPSALQSAGSQRHRYKYKTHSQPNWEICGESSDRVGNSIRHLLHFRHVLLVLRCFRPVWPLQCSGQLEVSFPDHELGG